MFAQDASEKERAQTQYYRQNVGLVQYSLNNPDCQGAEDKQRTQYLLIPCVKILTIPKSECPDVWIRVPRLKWPKSWCSMEDPVVALERNLYGHREAGPYGKGNLRKSC